MPNRHHEEVERMPFVIDGDAEKMLAVKIFSHLLDERIVFLTGEIDSKKADAIVSQLLYLDKQDPDKDIWLYVNSPGGEVTAGMAIYDTMQYVHADVATLCMGQAASMGALLLAAGAPKKRFALPNARIMIHQPAGGAYGVAMDVQIQTKEILRMKKRLSEILVHHTGQPYEKVVVDTERDYYMSAEEAKEYGLIDKMITKKTNRK
ncbi:MAG: ATP-dependent Clp protease proteolytic subunit [Myxococcales bacterium]|nr:ATP-dependent Clp protease proteolytic subunit [Myxococcales bacterium]